MRSQSTHRPPSHYPAQSPSVCHKCEPTSQLQNSFIFMSSIRLPRSILCFVFTAPTPHPPGCTNIAQMLAEILLVINSCGLSLVSEECHPCPPPSVWKMSQESPKIRGLSQQEVQDMSPLRVRWSRLKAIYMKGTQVRFNRVFASQVLAALV